MTHSKAYNLKVYCDLKNIDIESDEAKEFLGKTFYEQLTVIKGLRPSNTKEEEEEESVSYSTLDRLFRK